MTPDHSKHMPAAQWPGSGSIRGRTGVLDDLRPLHDFGTDESSELLRRVIYRIGAKLSHTLTHISSAHDARHLGMQTPDDCRRGTRGRKNAVPTDRLITGDPGLRDRRHVRQVWRPRAAGLCKSAQASRLDVRERGDEDFECDRHLSADDIGYSRT